MEMYWYFGFEQDLSNRNPAILQNSNDSTSAFLSIREVNMSILDKIHILLSYHLHSLLNLVIGYRFFSPLAYHQLDSSLML